MSRHDSLVRVLHDPIQQQDEINKCDVTRYLSYWPDLISTNTREVPS
jgi:hypothetical protein